MLGLLGLDVLFWSPSEHMLYRNKALFDMEIIPTDYPHTWYALKDGKLVYVVGELEDLAKMNGLEFLVGK